MCKTRTRREATSGAEYWTVDKDTAKGLAAFQTKVLRRMFGGIKVNENWRKGYNKELMQLLGDLDKLPFGYAAICHNNSAELNWSY